MIRVVHYTVHSHIATSCAHHQILIISFSVLDENFLPGIIPKWGYKIPGFILIHGTTAENVSSWSHFLQSGTKNGPNQEEAVPDPCPDSKP